MIGLLANPASDRGRGAETLRRAQAALRARGVEARSWTTTAPGEAVDLARRAACAEVDLLLVIGGDGTVRDVAQGLCDGATRRDAPVLGLVPAGTGNDLARTLGIPRAVEGALAVALDGAERALDVWSWDGCVFLNVAGIGLDAAVAELVNSRFRRLRGAAAYVAAFCAAMPRFQPFDVELSWPEGEWTGQAWVVALANACCYGGGMRIAPMAVPDDGLLDIVVIEAISRLELLREFPGIFAGAHVRHPRVRTFQVESVRVVTPSQRATIDGELIASAPARVTHSGSLRVRVPAAPQLPGGARA